MKCPYCGVSGQSRVVDTSHDSSGGIRRRRECKDCGERFSSYGRLADQIETNLQRMGKAEISSRVVGDMVVEGLKSLDAIAYVRYAIVYLRLDNLDSVRQEINKLLEEQSNPPAKSGKTARS